MATDNQAALPRLLTRADEFLTFLDERWYATLPRCEDDTAILNSRSIVIVHRFARERKRLARGAMGSTKQVEVLLPSDIVAMFDIFKGVLHSTFFQATILVSRDLNYSYEVNVREALENAARHA